MGTWTQTRGPSTCTSTSLVPRTGPLVWLCLWDVSPCAADTKLTSSRAWELLKGKGVVCPCTAQPGTEPLQGRKPLLFLTCPLSSLGQPKRGSLS